MRYFRRIWILPTWKQHQWYSMPPGGGGANRDLTITLCSISFCSLKSLLSGHHPLNFLNLQRFLSLVSFASKWRYNVKKKNIYMCMCFMHVCVHTYSKLLRSVVVKKGKCQRDLNWNYGFGMLIIGPWGNYLIYLDLSVLTLKMGVKIGTPSKGFLRI